jgi:spore coat protein CotH
MTTGNDWRNGVRCACAAAGLVLAAAAGSALAQRLEADRILDPRELIEVQIELPEADWQSLCRQTRDIGAVFSGGSVQSPFTYFKGNVSINGVRIEAVGIRKKGFIGSLDEERPSLKIKFDEYVDQDPVEGLGLMTLNNNKQDESQVSQFLAYKVFNAAGVHAPRANFARVTVNGEYLGIYTHVESIKKPFLRRGFGDGSGNLYEGTLADFHPKSVGKLEAETNEETNDRARLARLADLLTGGGELPLDEVERLVDVDAFLKFWATEALIRFWDGYTANQNNFYIYENPSSGKIHFIPWGADGAFQGAGPFGFFSGQRGTSIYAQSVLANRLYHVPGIPERYRQTMQSLLDQAWKEEELVAEIDRIEALIADHLHARQRNTGRAMERARKFIRARRGEIEQELQAWPAEVPSEPRKPMYTVDVGHARGTFQATWRDEPADESAQAGAADIALRLDGADVTLADVTAIAQPMQRPRFGFGGPGGPFGAGEPPVTVVLSGTRAADGEPVTLTLSIDRASFAPTRGSSTAVRGMLSEDDGRRGGGFGLNPAGMRMIDGQIRLVEASTAPGQPVTGEFDVRIVEMHGGFFDRPRQGGPAQAERERRPRQESFQFGPGAIAGALDTNRDGELSTEEIESASRSLRALDKNHDNKLDADELTSGGSPPPRDGSGE